MKPPPSHVHNMDVPSHPAGVRGLKLCAKGRLL